MGRGSTMFSGFMEGFTKTLSEGILAEERARLEMEREKARDMRQDALMKWQAQNVSTEAEKTRTFSGEQSKAQREAAAEEGRLIREQAAKFHKDDVDFRQEQATDEVFRELGRQNEAARLQKEKIQADKDIHKATNETTLAAAKINKDATVQANKDNINAKIEADKQSKKDALIEKASKTAIDAGYSPDADPEKFNLVVASILEGRTPEGYTAPVKTPGLLDMVSDFFARKTQPSTKASATTPPTALSSTTPSGTGVNGRGASGSFGPPTVSQNEVKVGTSSKVPSASDLSRAEQILAKNPTPQNIDLFRRHFGYIPSKYQLK